MTIAEAIRSVEDYQNNTYSVYQKAAWLSELDGRIKLSVIDTHEGGCEVTFSGYNESTPPDTVLLVPAPFEEIYTRWLEAKMCYADGELENYNTAKAMYNAVYSAFADHYNAAHRPLHSGGRFVF